MTMIDISQIISNSRFDKEPSQISLFDCMKYIFGGEATFTVYSISQDKKYVFQCNQLVTEVNGKDIKHNMYFLSLLTGNDNTSNYTYVGTIDNKESNMPHILTLRLTDKSKMTSEAPAYKLFYTLLYSLQCHPEYIATLLHRIKVYHDGHCSICGYKLTSVVSTNVGMGPVCAPEVHKDYKLECKRRGIKLPKNER